MLNYRFGLCFGDTSSTRDLAKIGREKQSICISVRCFIIYHHRIYLYIFYSVMLTYWIPSLPNKYFTSLLLKRFFLYVCVHLSRCSCGLGWVGFGGGVDLLGDDGIKPTDNQVAGCLKKFQCSDLFFFFCTIPI